MSNSSFVDRDLLRARFSDAMSQMYRREVPQYGTLLELVADTNRAVLAADPALAERLRASGDLERLSGERHGAIRVGTPEELRDIRRLFAVMGMTAVGYYDLSPAGVPVHSTAFRAVHEDALRVSPFRVFTSLLRLELVEDTALRELAAELLARRRIFTDRALALIDQCERAGGLTEAEGEEFIAEALHTFRWHAQATVTAAQYKALHDQHRLVADVVAFKGPHINHLTPRTLDIDAVQRDMPARGISPKAVIEGPPRRACPVLLRQTSFKALQEQVAFVDQPDAPGAHTARFGEIEQRGVALTPKGRQTYDALLAAVRAEFGGTPDEDSAQRYYALLDKHFQALPDDEAGLRAQGLAYFTYHVIDAGRAGQARDIEALVANGAVGFTPIVYEDFLPVSAAGIFQSNLGEGARNDHLASSNQAQFHADLGAEVLDELALYAQTQERSIARCLSALGIASAAA